MNKLVLLFVALFLMMATRVFAASPEATQVSKILKDRTNGNDAFFTKLLSPGMNLETAKNDSHRIQSVNNRITSEVDQVVEAFKQATEENKVHAIKQVLNSIESDLIRSGGAYVNFYDGEPSGVTSRTILIIPKSNSAASAASLMNVISSYKRSAKNSDSLYEYETAQDLTSGRMKSRTGSDSSWLPPEAAAPFKISQGYAIKKCRQLLGWRCQTNYYRADSLLKSGDAFLMLFSSTIDLSQNPDHLDFTKDKRSTNQVLGATSVLVIKESAKWVMAYSTDFQYNQDKLSFIGVIQKEFQKDFSRYKQRVTNDLKVQPIEL